jgi:hypothetical protein
VSALTTTTTAAMPTNSTTNTRLLAVDAAPATPDDANPRHTVGSSVYASGRLRDGRVFGRPSALAAGADDSTSQSLASNQVRTAALGDGASVLGGLLTDGCRAALACADVTPPAPSPLLLLPHIAPFHRHRPLTRYRAPPSTHSWHRAR